MTLSVSSVSWMQKKRVETRLNTSSMSMRFVGVENDPDSQKNCMYVYICPHRLHINCWNSMCV